MPPEEADSTEGTAKPRQLAEPEECPGGAKIKPPFEMGVSDLDDIFAVAVTIGRRSFFPCEFYLAVIRYLRF